MNIRLQKTSDLITPSLRRKLAAVQDKRPYLSAMGLTVVQLAKRAFTDSSLRSSAWAARKDRQTHNLLLKTGSLRASLRLLSVTDSAAYIGSDRKYAGYQQLGTRHIPARPFFPFYSDGKATPRAAEAVRRALETRLRARLKG